MRLTTATSRCRSCRCRMHAFTWWMKRSTQPIWEQTVVGSGPRPGRGRAQQWDPNYRPGYHGDDCLLGPWLLCLPQDRFEQQRVLGEPLVGLGQHVAQLQPLALLVLLSPLRGTGVGQGQSSGRPRPLLALEHLQLRWAHPFAPLPTSQPGPPSPSHRLGRGRCHAGGHACTPCSPPPPCSSGCRA